jgi:hypothetical protein
MSFYGPKLGEQVVSALTGLMSNVCGQAAAAGQ